MSMKMKFGCKNEICCNNEKLCGRFSDTVSKKIAFTAYGPHGDHPPV